MKEVYVVMSWGTDDVPIGIFDNYKEAQECAEKHDTGVYKMNINEEIEKRDFFNKIVKKSKKGTNKQ